MKKCKNLHSLLRNDSLQKLNNRKRLFKLFCDIVSIDFVDTKANFKWVPFIKVSHLKKQGIEDENIKLFIEFRDHWYSIFTSTKSFETKMKILMLFQDYTKKHDYSKMRSINRSLESICNKEIIHKNKLKYKKKNMGSIWNKRLC